MLSNVLLVTALCIQGTLSQYVSGYQRRYYVYRQPAIIYPAASAVGPTFISQPQPPVIAIGPAIAAQPQPPANDEKALPPANFEKERPPANFEKEQQLANADKVRVDVYYETDCPDSMRFITTQLYPTFQDLEDIVDIRLVPYGKAWESFNPISRKYDFQCQHGPSECYGNTVQSCAFQFYPKIKDKMNFANCMESYPRPSQSAQKCARRLSLDWEKIEKCATGDEGNRLLHENAQLTENLKPKLYFVPWIVINKVFSERTQRLSQRDLKTVICDAYKGPKHSSCRGP